MDIGAGGRESLTVRGCRGDRPGIGFMRRISAIFIAVCMVLIAGSIGARALSRPQARRADLGDRRARRAHRPGAVSMPSATALRDRAELGDQIADLSRGTGDLARQVANCRAGSPPWKAASRAPSAGCAARSIRSPPRSANWAAWCARSPKPSPAMPPPCSSRAPRRRPADAAMPRPTAPMPRSR